MYRLPALLATEINWPLAFNTFVIAFGFLTQWLRDRKAAKKVQAAKDKLTQTNTDTTKQLGAIHTLVNSNMGIQLRLNRELSEWKASQTHNPQDVEAAQLSAKLYDEHEAKQREVDEQKPPLVEPDLT